jgi:acetyl-CoA carboxylase carboxyltransferase component
VMGPQQLAGVLDIIARAGARARGAEVDEAQAEAMRQAVEDQVERESRALYNTARVYDDGIVDPRDTRTVLGLALSAAHGTPVEGVRDGWGVFRL